MSYSAAAKALISASFASDLFSSPVAVKTPTSLIPVNPVNALNCARAASYVPAAELSSRAQAFSEQPVSQDPVDLIQLR